MNGKNIYSNGTAQYSFIVHIYKYKMTKYVTKQIQLSVM
jgi:hypothetical protein